MVVRNLAKVNVRVRFPLSAPRPYLLVVRIPGFHLGEQSSILCRATNSDIIVIHLPIRGGILTYSLERGIKW